MANDSWSRSRSGWRIAAVSALTPLLGVPGVTPTHAQPEPPGLLEIHYINVGQGGSTLIIGPDGTRILYDFGGREARNTILPYLETHVGLAPEDGLHYAFVSHGDKDHYVGYRGVVKAGYDVLVANYGPLRPEDQQSGMRARFWYDPAAERTTAGPVRPVPVGLRIALGGGAEATVVAANGRVLSDRAGDDDWPIASPSNTNDQSVALFVRYGDFHYVLDGDLGAGREGCTQHDTTQIDVQSRLAEALLGVGLMTADHGVDVMHVAHHGSESSTSSVYYNLMKPEVGLISVGKNQGSFKHPRIDVVDRVLLADGAVARADCVEAPALEKMSVFQTEEGKAGASSTGSTSFSGLPIGDIRLLTDGDSIYTIAGSDRVDETSRGEAEACDCWIFVVDEKGGTSTGQCVGPGLPQDQVIASCLGPRLWE